jgi:HD-like signal output (HDOD) protein
MDGGVENLEAEKRVLGTTHAEIGGKMAHRWDFPPPLVDAITHHHDQNWQVNPKLGRILHYADLFVLGSIDFTHLLSAFSQVGMSHPASWDHSDMEEVEEILRGEIEKAQSMLSVSAGLR